MKLAFWKLSGAGNDFVLFDEGQLKIKASELTAFVSSVCDRRSGVGADGVLIVKRGQPPRLRYYNADGSAAFCGNGTRCAARWFFDQGWTSGADEFALETSTGLLQAKIIGGGAAAVRMPDPTRLETGLSVDALEESHPVNFIDTGAPHAVLFVEDLPSAPVESLDRALREHPRFAPEGTNVDFVKAGKVLEMRTYERGVEAETSACGTGALAAAVIACALGKAQPPVEIRMPGGSLLARFSWKDRRATETWLEGPTRTAFSGELEPEQYRGA